MTMKRIYVNEEYCIGCRLCEIHCLVQHSQSKKIIKAFREEDPGRCLGCWSRKRARCLLPCSAATAQKPRCVEACLTGAMHRDESSGAVLCDEDKCVGCWMCVMVCPFGAIQRNMVRAQGRLQVRPVLRREDAGLRGPLPERGAGLCGSAGVSTRSEKGTANEAPHMRHVIVGNSAAAIGAIEAIRQHDRDNPITVVADEPHHVYSRPLISYLLGGLVDEKRMCYRPPDFYERHKVETMLGVEVTRVDAAERTISLRGGGLAPYDRLLIATGGKPFVPPLPGADLDGVFTFTRLDDARQIERYIEEHHVESALVVGGGLIGLKTTEALMARCDPDHRRRAGRPHPQHHFRPHGVPDGEEAAAQGKRDGADRHDGAGDRRARRASRPRRPARRRAGELRPGGVRHRRAPQHRPDPGRRRHPGRARHRAWIGTCAPASPTSTRPETAWRPMTCCWMLPAHRHLAQCLSPGTRRGLQHGRRGQEV